jgi:uncharacterized membrane protein YdfJ with MMPL/SSD domain
MMTAVLVAALAAVASAVLSALSYWRISAILASVIQWFLMAWGAAALLAIGALWKKIRDGSVASDRDSSPRSARARRRQQAADGGSR